MSEQIKLDRSALKQRQRLAVVASAEDVFGRETPTHSHAEGQLLSVSKGTFFCKMREQIWVVTPFRALWIPPNIEHSVYAKGHSIIRSAYLKKNICTKELLKAKVIYVTAFLRELILEVAQFNLLRLPDSHENLLLRVLVGEIKKLKARPAKIPAVQDERLQKILESIYLAPNLNAREIEKKHHLSSRTLKRLFQQHLGVTFSLWRRQARIDLAIRLLDDKQLNIAEVGFGCGYESLSAFSCAFKEVTGQTPSDYRRTSSK